MAREVDSVDGSNIEDIVHLLVEVRPGLYTHRFHEVAYTEHTIRMELPVRVQYVTYKQLHSALHVDSICISYHRTLYNVNDNHTTTFSRLTAADATA